MPQNADKISSLANRVMNLAHDDILMHLRFFDLALSKLKRKEQPMLGCFALNGDTLQYDPVVALTAYREDIHSVTRIYLHMLLHCIFAHSYRYEKLSGEDWDLAADIAVENVILDMGLSKVSMKQDEDARRKLLVMQEEIGALTAERIYRYFRHNPLTPTQRKELQELFARDNHTLWMPAEQMELTQEEWKKISERVRAEVRTFSKDKAGAESLEKNLDETTRERYDYSSILQSFTVMGEDVRVNEDEFDYIYYTYGLKTYGNMPLIEPLEYKEVQKIREFVIAIDTSASCRGAIVRNFLRKTYSILKSSENFFHKVNIHVIQCDSEVQSDTKITCDEEFETFMKYGKLRGFGATDFRPVFEYVDRLCQQSEFENLKGMIYFTDGYGIYPEKMPDYDVIFAFLEEDENRSPVPPWSMKVILESIELEENNEY